MNTHIRDCLVDGYQELIPALNLPDPDDRHILAAAIKASADVIVTYNLKDFPKDVLAVYEIIEAQHPDEFITHLIDLRAAKVVEAAEQQLKSLKNPPKTKEEYLETLLKQGLPQTVAVLNDLMPS